MWKNLKICLTSLGLLSSLGLSVAVPAFGAEVSGSLLVTSHVIRVSQNIWEQETFCYEITEEIEVENRGPVTYRGSLFFWVGKGEDFAAVAFKENGESVDLEVAAREGTASTELKEGVFIGSGQKLRVELDYKVLFADPKESAEFQKRILYLHARESLQFQVNPFENLGFKPNLSGFPMEKSPEADGWLISPRLSPSPGEVYSLAITREGEGGQPRSREEEGAGFQEAEGESGEAVVREDEERRPVIVSEEMGKLPEEIRFFSARFKRWIWEHLLLAIVLNDAFVLGIVGYKCGWFKKFLVKIPRFPRITLTRGRKRGRKKRS